MTEEQYIEASKINRSISRTHNESEGLVSRLLSDEFPEEYEAVITEAVAKIRGVAASQIEELKKKFSEL